MEGTLKKIVSHSWTLWSSHIFPLTIIRQEKSQNNYTRQWGNFSWQQGIMNNYESCLFGISVVIVSAGLMIINKNGCWLLSDPASHPITDDPHLKGSKFMHKKQEAFAHFSSLCSQWKGIFIFYGAQMGHSRREINASAGNCKNKQVRTIKHPSCHHHHHRHNELVWCRCSMANISPST